MVRVKNQRKDFAINDDDFADTRSAVFKDVASQTRQN